MTNTRYRRTAGFGMVIALLALIAVWAAIPQPAGVEAQSEVLFTPTPNRTPTPTWTPVPRIPPVATIRPLSATIPAIRTIPAIPTIPPVPTLPAVALTQPLAAEPAPADPQTAVDSDQSNQEVPEA